MGAQSFSPMYNLVAILVTQVAHFSKYGLQDSDDEEEDCPSKVDAKKLKTMPVPPPGLSLPQHMALNGKPAPPAQVEGGCCLPKMGIPKLEYEEWLVLGEGLVMRQIGWNTEE